MNAIGGFFVGFASLGTVQIDYFRDASTLATRKMKNGSSLDKNPNGADY